MKENGEKIKQMVVENSGMLTETYMKVNGKMIKQTAMELIFMLTVHNMRGTGKMIYKTVKVWNHGKMEVIMKVATKKE